MNTVLTASSAACPPEAPRRSGPRRRPGAGAAALVLWAALAAAYALSACSGDEWPERDPIVIERAGVDSLEFLPAGTRYILADSLTSVRVRGLRLGYACTRILAMDLEENTFVQPPGFAARIRLELPSAPTCAALDSAVDTVIQRRFDASEGPDIILLDTAGAPFDTAVLVRGTSVLDSFVHVPGSIANITIAGRFTWYDTATVSPRTLAADSLNSCELLSHAEWSRRRDTTTVRYTLVTLDSAASPDSCRGTRTDRIENVRAR